MVNCSNNMQMQMGLQKRKIRYYILSTQYFYST